MKVKTLTYRTLSALLWSAMTVSSAVFFGAGATSSSVSPSIASQDIMRTFQLGNYSYELSRLSQYDSDHLCHGHKSKHAETVMGKIERACGPVTYSAGTPAEILLRESNYFDCGRHQLRVDVINGENLGQQCGVRFINANGKEWISVGELNARKDRALLGLAVAVGVLAMMW